MVASFAVRSVGRDVAPGLVGVAIAAAVMFSPSGLDPRDVVRWLDGSFGARLALFGAAILFCGSSARAALVPPGHVLLRSSPVPQGLVLGHAFVVLAVGALPMALVVGAGGGVLRGMATACAIGTLGVARFARTELSGVLGLVVGAVSLVVQAEAPELGAGGAAASFAVCVPIAHRRAPELAASAFSVSPRVPLLALASVHALTTVREEPARLARAVLFAGLGVFVAATVEARSPSADVFEAMRTAGTCLALPVAAAFATLAPALARTRRAVTPLIWASGAWSALDVAALLAVPAVLAAVLGGAFAIATPGLAPEARACAAAFAVELAISIAIAVLCLERREVRLAARRQCEGVRLGLEASQGGGVSSSPPRSRFSVEWMLFAALAAGLSNVTAAGAVIGGAVVSASGGWALARRES